MGLYPRTQTRHLSETAARSQSSGLLHCTAGRAGLHLGEGGDVTKTHTKRREEEARGEKKKDSKVQEEKEKRQIETGTVLAKGSCLHLTFLLHILVGMQSHSSSCFSLKLGDMNACTNLSMACTDTLAYSA